MRKSIFDLEIRVNVNYEFGNLKEILFEENTLYYNNDFQSLYTFLNDEIFPIWKYKGMFMNFDDFANRLEINFDSYYCSEVNFLYLLELLINLWSIAEKKLKPEYDRYYSKKVLGYMRMNLPLIIEKMNYQIDIEDQKFRLIKRDSDVDSVLEIVPDNCSKLLLDYNDIRNNSLEIKKNILKDLDLYIENDKKKYQSIDNDTYNTIQVVVNKMGVNHPIKEEPYVSLTHDELIKWYDRCFKLIIHLIRKKEINEINKKRKEFTND